MQPQEAFQGSDSKKEARAELGLFLIWEITSEDSDDGAGILNMQVGTYETNSYYGYYHLISMHKLGGISDKTEGHMKNNQ